MLTRRGTGRSCQCLLTPLRGSRLLRRRQPVRITNQQFELRRHPNLYSLVIVSIPHVDQHPHRLQRPSTREVSAYDVRAILTEPNFEVRLLAWGRSVLTTSLIFVLE
jgi:hypothetical protein